MRLQDVVKHSITGGDWAGSTAAIESYGDQIVRYRLHGQFVTQSALVSQLGGDTVLDMINQLVNKTGQIINGFPKFAELQKQEHSINLPGVSVSTTGYGMTLATLSRLEYLASTGMQATGLLKREFQGFNKLLAVKFREISREINEAAYKIYKKNVLDIPPVAGQQPYHYSHYAVEHGYSDYDIGGSKDRVVQGATRATLGDIIQHSFSYMSLDSEVGAVGLAIGNIYVPQRNLEEGEQPFPLENYADYPIEENDYFPYYGMFVDYGHRIGKSDRRIAPRPFVQEMIREGTAILEKRMGTSESIINALGAISEQLKGYIRGIRIEHGIDKAFSGFDYDTGKPAFRLRDLWVGDDIQEIPLPINTVDYLRDAKSFSRPPSSWTDIFGSSGLY